MERDNWIRLFDLYKDLLTENEINAFKDYYEEDLSLGEMAENKQVSRTAIHNTLKKTEEKLISLENALHLKEKEDVLLESLELTDIQSIKKNIEKVLNN